VPHKLLLADDSVTIQRVIELTFAEEDIQVVAVGDGDQAIARLDADPPDIVLADVGMPGRNGYEVAAYVKNSPRLAHIPVVLLTGAFEPVDQPRADAAGCDGVLAKPFEPQLVISRVKELLARPARPPISHEADSAPPPLLTAESSTPPAADPPVAPPAARPSAGTGSDDYFDRLDAAFASLSNGAAPPPARPRSSRPGEDNPVADSIDWFGHKATSPDSVSARPPDVPLSYGSPESDFARPAAPPPPPAPVIPVPAPRPTLPPLADAFAALLAAEQSGSAAVTAPQWPASTTPPAPSLAPPAPPEPAARLVITDDLIEAVTRRVLERLSDQVVRETVAEIVSATAERLVREEIERIKRTIE
jgi:CheY-like chemotaxis protein